MSAKPPALSPRQVTAVAAAASRERWAQIHAENVRIDNILCETYGFSRPGYVKGERVPVATLRRTVDKQGENSI